MADNLKLFLFGQELDCDSLVAEAGDWRVVFEALATELNLFFFAMPRYTIRSEFRLVLEGEEVDLDALSEEVGRDWRPILNRLAPKFDVIFT